MADRIKRRLLRRGKKPGLAPGTPVFVGERRRADVRIHVMAYGEGRLVEKECASIEDCVRPEGVAGVTWINVAAVHDVPLIEALGKRFGFHPLTLEDIVNTTQRPKAEDYGEYLFLVLKMMTYSEASRDVEMEHVSLLVGAGYVISFLEDEGDVFDPVRERIRSNKGRIRSLSPDYLAYALMDAVVDHYFLALERVGEDIEDLDEAIILEPAPEHMQAIHRLKRSVLGVRKAVWPLREEINVIDKSGSVLIHEGTRVYLRDVYDHTIQVIDMVENYRELLNGMHDTYLSSVSNRLNEIMRVLTIIATIFIPLTFIVGVYGMNFEYMPELRTRWGYFAVWGVMIGVAAGLVMFFRKRKWL